MSRKQNIFGRNSGFTIVELIVIIVIISILATIATISFNGSQERAHKSSANATLQQVKLKLGEHFTDNNTYPCDTSDVLTYLDTVNQGTLHDSFEEISNDTTNFSYTTSGTPSCTNYEITLQSEYWGGDSSDTDIVVQP